MALVPSPVDPAWAAAWKEHVADIRSDVPIEASAERMRALVRSGLLSFSGSFPVSIARNAEPDPLFPRSVPDVQTDPAKFFAAHRLFVDPRTRGPGSWIRLTVHYNLFAGTVFGLGTEAHVAVLREMEEKGELGCFALTEKFAGVNSGLVVNTTATWVPGRGVFVLESADEGAQKNWISQGVVAEKAAVVADLRIAGKSYGPHGFLMTFRENGKLVPGVTLGDMGRKTTGNDLDNAWIRFDGAELPKSALLNRYADVDGDKYVQKGKERMRIEIIGQRLLSGRVAVAQAALAFARRLFEMTRGYSDAKMCWSPTGKVPLSSLPQLRALYAEADATLARLDNYLARVEAKLSVNLRQNTVPPPDVVEAIAVGKVAAVEAAIDLCWRLKQEVGSYALMAGTGFEHADFLQCCKFAEGDSRILMQKLARDRYRTFQNASKTLPRPPSADDEDALCAKIAGAGKDGWDREFGSVYGLAGKVIERTMARL
ncbi:acyl-CoA dehydrogenase/oxidase [Hyaloraphidium curvatum]|nr:acyl-CoA dehydrogenase/oxidase [Hyaloraphidium curvatum]